MLPKIEAGIDFVRHSPHSDAVAIIAHVKHFAAALDRKSGTRIVRN
jgi:carbamate kinase